MRCGGNAERATSRPTARPTRPRRPVARRARLRCVTISVLAARKCHTLRQKWAPSYETTWEAVGRVGKCTHLARTMVDLASVLDTVWLRAALDSALRQRKTNLAWIHRALDHHGNGRRGAACLRTLVSDHQREDEVPDSVLESMGIELALAMKRKPKLHWRILEGARLIAEVDFAWPEERLCVELDGWTQHGTRAAFVRDRARDRALLRLGWMVLRFTWQDVVADRESVIAELASCYESRTRSVTVIAEPSRRRSRTQTGA